MDGLAQMTLNDVSFLGINAGSVVNQVVLIIGHASGYKKDLHRIQLYTTSHSTTCFASRGAGMDGLARMTLDDVSLLGTNAGSLVKGCAHRWAHIRV